MVMEKLSKKTKPEIKWRIYGIEFNLLSLLNDHIDEVRKLNNEIDEDIEEQLDQALEILTGIIIKIHQKTKDK